MLSMFAITAQQGGEGAQKGIFHINYWALEGKKTQQQHRDLLKCRTCHIEWNASRFD